LEDLGPVRNYNHVWKSGPEQKDMFVANKQDEHDQTRLLDSLETSFSSICCIDGAKAREENSIKETHVRRRNRVENLGVVKAVGIAMIEAHGKWRGIDANSDIGGRTRHVTFLTNRISEKLVVNREWPRDMGQEKAIQTARGPCDGRRKTAQGQSEVVMDMSQGRSGSMTIELPHGTFPGALRGFWTHEHSKPQYSVYAHTDLERFSPSSSSC
jgi:hypothetical protein